MCSGRIENGCGMPLSCRARSPRTTFEVPTKSATNVVAGAHVELARGVDLLDAALVEDGDAVGHRQRLVLVVGDEDEGDAELALQLLQLALHLLAQLQVERAQRLVEQQHAGLVDQRARQGHALALAAGQLHRVARAIAAEGDHGQRLFGRAVALGFGSRL